MRTQQLSHRREDPVLWVTSHERPWPKRTWPRSLNQHVPSGSRSLCPELERLSWGPPQSRLKSHGDFSAVIETVFLKFRGKSRATCGCRSSRGLWWLHALLMWFRFTLLAHSGKLPTFYWGPFFIFLSSLRWPHKYFHADGYQNITLRKAQPNILCSSLKKKVLKAQFLKNQFLLFDTSLPAWVLYFFTRLQLQFRKENASF